jgi:cytochrome P450
MTPPSTPEEIIYERCARPREYFARLRDKAPVDTEEGLGGRIQVLTLDAGDLVLHDPATFSSSLAGAQPGRPKVIPLQIDPPDHARYRKLLNPAFAPKRVNPLEADVAALTNQLIDTFIADGRCDFSQQLSIPLPSAIFLRIFGLPIEGLSEFLEIKDGILRAQGATEEERTAVRTEAGRRSTELFRRVIDKRTADPQDDLITQLIQSEVEGVRLTRDELLDICNLLLLAGLDTVSITLQCMLHHLAQHPEQRRQIADDESLIPNAVEELLRWETPVQGVTRVATREVELGGQTFPAGSLVQVMLSSLNTDPTTSADFDRIDLDRGDKRHHAFGGGIHRCLGSHLARLELRVALREWHRRIPDYELVPGSAPSWNLAPLRGIDHLELQWTTS